MRNLKKFLALVLALMMAMSLMVTANAAVTSNVVYSDDYTVNEAFEEAVTVLSGMGVIKGYNGGENVGPKQNITRAEAATLVYRLATGDVDGERDYLYTDFALQNGLSDVTSDKWYAGAVGYCANFGIVKGRSDGLFHANDPVTGYEILAMILRVVGYDQNNEFSGADWAYRVSTLATSLGVVDKVKTANYSAGGTSNLYGPATREVVASLLFETITGVPKVTYSAALSYMDTGMENGLLRGGKNPTVGYDIFGLTSHYGIVLGNEATGEGKDVTKIGFSVDGPGASSDHINDNTTKEAYYYATDKGYSPANVTLSFKWDSGLDLFNHRVKVWYDYRSSAKENVGAAPDYRFGTNLNTFAVFDKVVSTAVVTAGDVSLVTKDKNSAAANGALRGAASNSWDPNETNNWKAPGFKFHSEQIGSDTDADNVAFFNYSFAAMGEDNWGHDGNVVADATTTNKLSGVSPVKENNSTDGHPLYLLISNTEGNVLDVVITLDMTVSQIAQANTTTKPYSVGVTNANGTPGTAAGTPGANSYFGEPKDIANAYGTTTSWNYVNLAQKNLVKSPKTTLGTKVAAIEITGTNSGVITAVAAGGNDAQTAPDPSDSAGAAGNDSPMRSKYYYQLSELTHVVPGTVVKIDRQNQDVYLSDGSVLHKSVFAEAADGTFMRNAQINAPENFGTFSFTLDNQGNYIYWESNNATSTFVYATYLDYTTELASSSFVYPLVYVDTQGQRGQKNIASINDTAMNINLYVDSKLNRRDNGGSTGMASGYVKGWYKGYAMSDSGALLEVTDSNSRSTGFVRANEYNFGYNQIQIRSADVSIGAKSVPNDPAAPAGQDNYNLFLTENTTFYIVDGAGTDNQKVETKKGLSDLMKGMSSVVINATNTATAGVQGINAPSIESKDGKYLVKTDSASTDFSPFDMIYYEANAFTYAQNYDTSAREIKTVYIPKDLITFNPEVSSSLYFLGDSTDVLLNTIGEKASLFTMYQNGEKVQRWITGDYRDNSTDSNGDYTSDAFIVADDGAGFDNAASHYKNDNNFYCLIDTGKKANDGQPIYKIAPVEQPSTKILGAYWNGDRDGTGKVWTFPGLGYTYPVHYTATTYSTQIAYLGDGSRHDSATNLLYNVGNAKVKNLDTVTYPGIKDNDLATLNAAGSLADNSGVAVSCILDSTDTNYRTVSFIYVNYND